MRRARNILWIMCDQLRFDYLSCAGHKSLHTRNIDALAARGVRFTSAYVQSPVCGPSRMSFYTGRYMRSHGSHWNGFPLRLGEPTLGDHLRDIGVRNVLVGKTHMRADAEGMARLGIPPDSVIGVHVSQCGFEPYERDDGLHPDAYPRPRYDDYLRSRGFTGDNPWEQWANSGIDENGNLQNGWLLTHADKAARVTEEDSETPYMTRRAMDFLREAGADGRPWCLHLSYIKPHWPYIAPAPYHNMYGPETVQPVVRSASEQQNPHEVYRAFMDFRVSRNFSDDALRAKVVRAYMGLIKQIDDQLGLLFRFLDDQNLTDSTMIVFTSDHGDYLGDHWLGEKDLFHNCSAKIPLIIADPSPEADATRGTVNDSLVEAIDLAPTFLDYFGGMPPTHILEGASLMPWLHAKSPTPWRGCVFSEYDYSMQQARLMLNQPIGDCRLFMVFDGRWKYIHATGFRPMLFDLGTDPQELRDLGDDPGYVAECARLRDSLLVWALGGRSRVTMPDARIEAYGKGAAFKAGILIGFRDEVELAEARRQMGD